MKLGKLIGYNPVTQNMDNGALFIDTPFKLFSTTITDPNYEDYSSIENWDKSTFLDWARRRDEISPLFYAEAGAQLQNFAGMSNAKKLLACKYFLIPYQIRMQLISDSDDKDNWDYLLRQTKLSREACVEAMRIKVGQYMRLGTITLAQTQDFYSKVFEYIILFNETNAPDFKQWLTNEVGSPYENNGFKQQTAYYSDQMRDDLIAIYNGNY